MLTGGRPVQSVLDGSTHGAEVSTRHNGSRQAVLANLKTRQRCESVDQALSKKSSDVYDRMTSLQKGSPARFASATRTTQ